MDSFNKTIDLNTKQAMRPLKNVHDNYNFSVDAHCTLLIHKIISVNFSKYKMAYSMPFLWKN